MKFRGEDWIEKRKEALERDEHSCRKCRRTNKDIKLHVHHIHPYRKIQHNNLWNLVTLCEECHKETENWFERVGMTGMMLRWIDQNYEAK